MPDKLGVAHTILAQLGGRQFIVMTGAKDFTGSANSLSFRLGRNPKNITHVKIVLNGLDPRLDSRLVL